MNKLAWVIATIVAAIAVIGGVIVGSGFKGDQSPPSAAVTTVVSPASPTSTADDYYALLDELEIKGRAPMTGYDRDQFGQAWSDNVSVEYGHNGCDTRNDILRRDLTDIAIRPGTHDCLVESGTLAEPYTGTTISFARGDGQVEIDHVVALGDAWAKGAQALDEDTRRDFANDPRNLLAVDTSANRQKGAGDAATWQPSNKAYRCEYARAQIVVKHAYHLWVTSAERDALARELARC